MGRRGFTLIEVMLALLILAFAGAIAYGSLSTALASWSAGVARGRRGQVARVALDRISQQLKSAVPARLNRDGRNVAAFDSAADSLRFVTALPVGGRPLAQVSYSVEIVDGEGRLVYRERPWPDKRFFEGGADPLVEEEVPGISGVAFEPKARKKPGAAAGDAGGGGEWVPGEESDLPAEVRVTLKTGEGDGEEVLSTVVPLLSTAFQPLGGAVR